MDFFQAHPGTGVLLLGLAVFPRITLLFVGGPFGWLHWLGWVFAPHLLVAILATTRSGTATRFCASWRGSSPSRAPARLAVATKGRGRAVTP
jgi:hypothetical protein